MKQKKGSVNSKTGNRNSSYRKSKKLKKKKTRVAYATYETTSGRLTSLI